jgi:hypothetical protein
VVEFVSFARRWKLGIDRILAGVDRQVVVLMVAGITFGVAAAAVIWIGFGRPRGLIYGMVHLATTGFVERLWPIVALVILSLTLTAIFVSQGIPFQTMPAAASTKHLRFLTTALLLCGVAASLLAVWALRALPYSADEYDYLFQAETFLRGRLWNPVLPGQEFFAFLWIAAKAGKWLSTFPPGWPFLLARAHWLRLPFWTVCPLLGAAALAFLAKLAGREAGPAGVLTTLALVVFAPFFAFNAGSFFNSLPTAAFGLMFCYFGARFIDSPDWRSAALIGAALGMVGVIRPFDTVIFAVPFGIEVLFRARRRHVAGMAVIVLGGLPCLAGLLLYSHAITGNAFLPILVWAYSITPVGVNAADSANGAPVSMLHEILMVKTRIWMLAEWTSPILVLSYLPAIGWKIFKHRSHFYDFILPAAIVAYLFFPALAATNTAHAITSRASC